MKYLKLRFVCLLTIILCSFTGLSATSQRPKLVLLIVLDGFRFDYLTRFDQYFAPAGLKLVLEHEDSHERIIELVILMDRDQLNERAVTGRWSLQFWAIGALGSLTTFSAFGLEVAQLLDNGAATMTLTPKRFAR